MGSHDECLHRQATHIVRGRETIYECSLLVGCSQIYMNSQTILQKTEPGYMSRDLCAGTNASHKSKYPPIMNHRNHSNNYSNCVIELFDDQLLDSVHIRDPSKDQTISKWSVKTATTVPLDEDDYDFDDDACWKDLTVQVFDKSGGGVR